MKNVVHNCDCMEYMKDIPDKWFELAIVDPPYGIGFGTFNRTNKDSAGNRSKANRYHHSNWDACIPDKKYFEGLKRVSKNQIIWGGNYFPIWPCKEFIFWYKQNPVNNFSDGELAFTSFGGVAKCFNYPYYGNINQDKDGRIHPTAKPIALYKWLLQNYAKPNDKIFDSHVGSGSIRIACHDMGFDFTGCELDPDYYQAQEERFKNHTKQSELFEFEGGNII